MSDRTHPQFRWLERGDGEPVVLLHGLMGHMDHWDATLDALAPSARLFAPERTISRTSTSDLSATAPRPKLPTAAKAMGSSTCVSSTAEAKRSARSATGFGSVSYGTSICSSTRATS